MGVGNRFNKNKLRWRNFPLFLVRPLVEIGHEGENKYGTYNFLKGLSVSDTLDSLHRHLDAVMDPTQDDIDEEMQVHHLAAVAWNALVALYHIKTRPELDDRFKIEEEDIDESVDNIINDVIREVSESTSNDSDIKTTTKRASNSCGGPCSNRK